MSRLPPQFGPFEPIQRLGAGGMAETFVAVRRGPAGFEQRVCIKRILPAYESDKDFVDAFLREARTSAQLRHANIVQVLDFGLADESHYLALELIDGIDLRALLKRLRRAAVPLEPELVTLVAGDLALALDHAHGGGQAREPIVHRDISPSNVLASRAGEIKLTDFGIARAIGGTHQTATGIIKGKVPYLPPEYIERGVFEARSDLFSLGVMLYELLSGQRPFDGESDLDTVRRIVSGESRPLASLVHSAPDALVSAIERLIAVHVDDRPASARALLDLLPQIAVHRARMRLGEMVRAELEEIATGEAALLVPRLSSTPEETRTHAPPPVSPRSSSQQRAVASSATPPARPAIGKGPRRALVASGVGVLALISALAVRSWTRSPEPKSARAPSDRALVTVAESAPPPAALTAAVPAKPLAHASAPAPVSAPAKPVEQPPSRRDSHAAAELRIVVIPFGDVWVDGKLRGHAPVNVRLSPGSHDIAWGDGRPNQRRTIQVTPGQRESLVFRDDKAK